MSSSPSPVAAIEARQAEPLASAPPAGEPFPYDAVAASVRTAGPGAASDGFGLGATPGAARDEAASREALICAQARQQGEAEARRAFEERLARERASLADALAEFTRDRAAYFQRVEGEVVQLALGIARHILHREAQLDPLLLAAVVRVALEKIDGATGVRLRLHPHNAADWRRYLATHLEPSDMPEFVEDPAQEPDRCTLETSMGTALIGLEVQFKEIEQGLMDLLAARPGAAQ